MSEIKYLLNGKAVAVKQAVENGFLVSDLYETDDGVEESDVVYFVEKVHEDVPEESYHPKIKALEDKLEELNIKKSELYSEISSLEQKKRDEKDLISRLSKYDALKYVEDFIKGEFTHYVVLEYSGEIIARQDAKCDGDHGWSHKDNTKLLSLFGDSKGNLRWELNRYRDGSGSWKNVSLCRSYEEAIEKLSAFILNSLEELETRKLHYLLRPLIESARKYNIEVPEKFTDLLKQNQEKDRLARIAVLEQELEGLKQGGQKR